MSGRDLARGCGWRFFVTYVGWHGDVVVHSRHRSERGARRSLRRAARRGCADLLLRQGSVVSLLEAASRRTIAVSSVELRLAHGE